MCIAICRTICRPARARGIDCTALLIQGSTPETLVREAARLHADLIMLGSHGHGAIHRALLGSVSEGVLHHARLPGAGPAGPAVP